MVTAAVRMDWPRATAELEKLFKTGGAPGVPLDGRYTGRLVRATINPLVDLAADGVAKVYTGWLGKRFDPAAQAGDNHFRGRMEWSMRLLWPHYPGIRPCPDGTFDDFPFRTWTGAGLLDPELLVLKIDYDLPTTPYTMRRVLDELVELPDGRLLGQAQVLTWWNQWTTVAYFALAPQDGV